VDSQGLIIWVTDAGRVGELHISGVHKIVLVPQLSGKKDVRSDLTGDRNTSDVSCECRVPQAYGVLGLHNVAHAHAVEIESHDLFHVKDRVETWKAQYQNSLEYPMLSDFAIYERLVGCAFLEPLSYNTTHIHTQFSTPILNCSHIHTQ